MEFRSCLGKQEHIEKKFLLLESAEEKYQELIQLGQRASPMDQEDKTQENLVSGCQSLLYLQVGCTGGVLSLSASSDALISAGLAQLLIQVYDEEPPLAVFHCPPLFLKKIGLIETLSPNRANGLQSLYKKLQSRVAYYLPSTA